MSRHAALPWVALIVFGIGWGLTQPLTKIAVTGGFQPFGLMVWQGVVSVLLAGSLAFRKGLPKGRAQWMFCLQVALLGTLFPHFASYTAMAELPAGLMAIILALIPIFALVLGALFGREALTPLRVIGVCMGLGAMMLIAATQGRVGSGPIWAIGVAMIAPLCYATNSTITARRGMSGLHPLQAFAGASMIFLPIALVSAAATGQLRGLGTDVASGAVVAGSALHTLIYAGYLWLVTRSGAVFSSQTAYLVTGFGVIWSMILLDERYSVLVWGALALILLGLTLVRPQKRNDHQTP